MRQLLFLITAFFTATFLFQFAAGMFKHERPPSSLPEGYRLVKVVTVKEASKRGEKVKASMPSTPAIPSRSTGKMPTPPKKVKTELPSNPPVISLPPPVVPLTDLVPPAKVPSSPPFRPEKKDTSQAPSSSKKSIGQSQRAALPGNENKEVPSLQAGGGTEQGEKRKREDYRSLLRSLIANHNYYPRRARRLNKEGTVRIKIILTADGGLKEILITHSSGSSLLDKAAMQAIQEASPFPPPPGGAEFVYAIPIRYNLKSAKTGGS